MQQKGPFTGGAGLIVCQCSTVFDGHGGTALPRGHNGYPVAGDLGIVADQRQSLCLRLRYQHAVKGIAVNQGETSGNLGVAEGDRKFGKASLTNALNQIIGELKSAIGTLDFKLPNTNNADENLVT